MSFLTPLFLVGLAALAIPVVIHLIQREKKRVVQFPSLMFLQRIPYKSIRRRRIHNWLLLLVRLAALALIVTAFGRPFLSGAQPMLTAAGAREVVVLLDRSYSMGFGDRWERARAAAREAVGRLDPGDRASLVLFSSSAEVAVRSTSERAQLVSAVDAASPSAGATRYAPALKVAASILTESTLPRREVVLVSDFQRSGWQGAEDAQLPAGATLTPMLVTGEAVGPNASVTTASLDRSSFSNQERVTVTAGVVNRSPQPIANAAMTLSLGGRPIESKQVSLEPHGTGSVTFAPFTVSAKDMRGTITLAADALAPDNLLHFVVSPLDPVRILVVDRSGAPAGASLYLVRALSIGDAPPFDVTVRSPDAVSDEDLRRAAVVLLNDVPVSSGFGARLARYVEGGGGLLAVLGPRATWPADRAGVLPVVLKAPVDQSRRAAARLGALEHGHAVFEPFRAPRSGSFSAARFYGYRGVTVADSAQVLARFDPGAPALIEGTLGKGRVLVWTSTLDLLWNDLPLKPVYLPFLHGIVRHLSVYTEAPPWLTVGQVVDPARRAGPASEVPAEVALTPSGARIPLDGKEAQVLELSEQGFYEIRAAAAGASGMVVASNVDAAESDLTPMEPQEVVAAATADGAAERASRGDEPLTPQAQERMQRVWWYLLCAGILLLGLDTVLSNRLSKA